MAKKKKHFNTQETIKELTKSKGMPEHIFTEAQLWDEIFKKEAFLMQDQFFSLIEEIHKKAYPNEVSVKLLATEYPVERVQTQKITSIRSDIILLVGGEDIYHFECEIGNDRAMVLRMFEYDAHVALEYHRLDSNAGQIGKGMSMVLPFPCSAVLYLQDNKNIPDMLSCKVRFSDGNTYEYTVAAVHVLSYSLAEIHKKHLSILIPFLPLKFRKRLSSNKEILQVKKEELTSFYQNIILILNEEIAGGYLIEDDRKVILHLLRKSMVRVFYKDEVLLEEVIKMTEPILELEFEIMEQFAREMAEQIAHKMAGPMAKEMAEPMAKEMAEPLIAQQVEQLKQEYKKSMEELTFQKDEEIAALKKQIWLLQNPQN